MALKPLKKVHLGFQWHDLHNRAVVAGFGGVGVRLVCLDCGVSSDLEAISTPLTQEEATSGKKMSEIVLARSGGAA